MASIPSTISGVTFSQAKLLANDEFGCKILKMEYNEDKCTYDVYVVVPVDKIKAKKFKGTWDNAFRIIPARLEDDKGAPVSIQENKSCDKKAPSTIKGLTFSQAKRIVNNRFGEDIIKVDQNVVIPSYDVYLSSEVDKKKSSEFQGNWENRFRVITVILEPAI